MVQNNGNRGPVAQPRPVVEPTDVVDVAEPRLGIPASPGHHSRVHSHADRRASHAKAADREVRRGGVLTGRDPGVLPACQ